jgi:AcrR family transcriptional regulator
MGKAKEHIKSEELLMAAAIKLFAERGYEGTSVKHIAEAAGVNVGLISYHFGGKFELYRRCFEHFGLQRLESVQRILVNASNLPELRVRISMFIQEMIEFNMDQSQISILVYREFEVNRKGLEDVFKRTFLRVFEALVSFLQSAKKNRLIKGSIDPLMCAGVFFSVISHMTRMNAAYERHFELSLNNKKQREMFIKLAVDTLLTGVLDKGE